jgi:hypothetical protein
MENAVCSDGRARGLLQFYGANRTGRFAGRLIQVQNLPQNHMLDLTQARQLVKSGNFEALELKLSRNVQSKNTQKSRRHIFRFSEPSIASTAKGSLPLTGCCKKCYNRSF